MESQNDNVPDPRSLGGGEAEKRGDGNNFKMKQHEYGSDPLNSLHSFRRKTSAWCPEESAAP